MKTIDFLQTAKWILGQFTEEAKSALFGPMRVTRLSTSGITIEGSYLEATYELATVRLKLLDHPSAADVLSVFGLEMLLEEDLPIKIARLMNDVSQNKNEDPGPAYERVSEFFSPLKKNWTLLRDCIEPIERLTIPRDVQSEQDFDDILTIELSYGSEINPSLSSIADVFGNVQVLYEAMCRLHGFAEFPSLRFVYADSGSSFRFDFRGLGEPIKRIKELMVEGWNLIRHRKAEDFKQHNKALLESLESMKLIHSMREEGVLENEDALRLHQQVLDSVTSLFQAGALPREVPANEYVPNYKLIEEYHRRLLPPAPAVVPKPRRRKTRKKSTKSDRKI